MNPVEVKPVRDNPPVAKLYYGQDVVDSLKLLPEASVHMVATSPPYWGLRDYGGGDDQIGLEGSPDEYVERLVEVFREVARVLRPDGALWLNLGDSYAGHHGNSKVPDNQAPSNKPGYVENMRRTTVGVGGLKSKDLVGIPWRVAFALQADGWYLRSDIIWAKNACMPESIRDRPTRAHEYIFLLAHPDGGGRYFYDLDAIREPHSSDKKGVNTGVPARRGPPDGGFLKNDALGRTHTGPVANRATAYYGNPAGRNKRSWWNINPRPYRGAHFAVWPPKLVEPMIRAGTSEKGCCPNCGAQWERIVVRKGEDGWQPGCACPEHEPVRSVVLDPFSGSATTGMVAFQEGRDYIGIDLNAEYLPLAKARLLGEKAPPFEKTDSTPSLIEELFSE